MQAKNENTEALTSKWKRYRNNRKLYVRQNINLIRFVIFHALNVMDGPSGRQRLQQQIIVLFLLIRRLGIKHVIVFGACTSNRSAILKGSEFEGKMRC